MILFKIIKIGLEIFLGLAVIIGIKRSFKLEGEKQLNEMLATVIILTILVMLMKAR